jgi:hypothetical protein
LPLHRQTVVIFSQQGSLKQFVDRQVIMLIRIVTLFTVFICIISLLAGCTLSRSAITQFRTNFNFSQVDSYRFYDRNSDFSDFQNINDTTRNSIELAIEQVLDKNGFVYQLEGEADIIVTYHLIKNGKEVNKYNKGIGYCSYCLRGGEAQISEKPFKITPGSLILDIINPQTESSVWRSVYDLKIKADRDNSKEVQSKIYEAIDMMMKKFPYTQNPKETKLVASR